ncbi:MAG: DUF438 domain-containing protein [Deltaproteobacteria bacterium]|uniref:DUF438 domain-containing protein n=1 Tax=Candidatus Zymogenus saltonus TaxID=2844893 RepID=A0A9D8PMM3_9DELT|nr:DUF438 domain-containing protein [Candidatus Zymogenus saltonus]
MKKGGRLPLDTGDLNIKEINHILNALPVDITFVDSDDKVRFFNRIGKRVFARTRGVIDKEVRNCHTKKSLDAVNDIVEGFKSKRRDTAEFWITLGGRLIFIRYFAVRDEEGKYIGCLEVSQDITEIKEIKGEKRLLD